MQPIQTIVRVGRLPLPVMPSVDEPAVLPPRRPRLGALAVTTIDGLVEDERVEGVVAVDADLVGVDAGWVTLDAVRLQRPRLADARLRRATLLDVEVEAGDLANARLLQASLVRTALERCRLTGAEFAESHLRDVAISGCAADLIGFRFARMERVAFVDCALTDADFQGARFEGVSFAGCDLTGAQFSQARISGCDLRGARLDGIKGLDSLVGAVIDPAQAVNMAGQLATALGLVVATGG